MEQSAFTVFRNDADEGNKPETPEAPEPRRGPASSKSKPARALPTRRLKVAKQIELLRAFALTSEYGTKAVHHGKAAELAGLASPTASLCNAFFYDVGLLARTDRGLMPSQHVIEFARAREWSPETATHKLSAVFLASWFGSSLAMRLKMRPLTESEALSLLGQEAEVGPDYRPELRMLLDYLETVGIIERSGETLRPGPAFDAVPDIVESDGEEMAQHHQDPDRDRSQRSTPPPVAASSDGVMQFHFSVRVTMADLTTWDADRITAFFNGMAKVIAAKNGGRAPE